MRRDPFQSIADPNRRRIIEILSKESPLTMNKLAEKFEISRPAISKHVRILEKSGVVEIRQIRVERFCYLKPESLMMVEDWVKQFLNSDTPKTKETKPKTKTEKPKKEAVKKAPPKKSPPKKKILPDDEEDQLSLF